MHHTLIFGLLLAVAAPACQSNPTPPPAKVEEPKAAQGSALNHSGATQAANVANAEKYTINGQNSSVEFTGAKVTGSHEGRFEEFTGTAHLVERDPAQSSVSVDIKVASLKVEPEKLAEHLRSEEFLFASKYPSATFVSTKLTPAGGGKFTVTGDFTLRGVTKSISFPATIETAAGKESVQAEFTINRKDYNVVYPGMPDDLIKDDVTIKLNLRPSKS